jgi:hypothetical protein
MATITMTVRRDGDGILNATSPACIGCGCEPEVVAWYRRTMTRRDSGEQVPVRVGYHCTCGAVIIDGVYQGHNPNTR